jgi:hypothetical protein
VSVELLNVNKYCVSARVAGGVVEWTFSVETDDGERHDLPIRDGEEIPILLSLVQKDTEVFYDPHTKTLSTGWNDPGE